MIDRKPIWEPVDDFQSIRSMIGQDTFQRIERAIKRIGGDYHAAVDANPASPTFGAIHWTLQLPSNTKTHAP